MVLVRFETVKEGFHEGIIVHVSRSIHALNDTAAGQSTSVGQCTVFDPPIAVKDQSRFRSSGLVRSVERLDREFGGSVLTPGPAHNAS